MLFFGLQPDMTVVEVWPRQRLVHIAVSATPAIAKDISYDYFEISYVFADELEIDSSAGGSGFDADVDGVNFGGSAEVVKYVYIRADNTSLDVDSDTLFLGDTALDLTSLAVGGYLPLISGSQTLHINGDISYERFDLVDEADGFGATVGLRWKPIRHLEISGNAGVAIMAAFLARLWTGLCMPSVSSTALPNRLP